MAKQIVKFTKNFALKFKVWNQHLIYFHIGKVPYCGFSVIEIFLSKHVFFFWKLKILKKLQLHVWLAILQADIMYPSVQFFRVLLPNEVISNAVVSWARSSTVTVVFQSNQHGNWYVTKNPTIFNIIRWVAWSMGWSSHLFLYLSLLCIKQTWPVSPTRAFRTTQVYDCQHCKGRWNYNTLKMCVWPLLQTPWDIWN